MNAVITRLKRISKTDDSTVIPPSHKWTEVGVLPKDWSIRSLRSCLLSVPSYGINEAAVPFDDDLPTYLRITDISKDGQFRPSPRVSVKHPNGQAFFLNEGDLVLARTGASVGKSYLYNPKDGPLVFAGFLIRISPNPEKLQPTFLAYCLQSKYYWNWVATMSIRSGQPGINGKEYGELQLPLPSLIEQRAIAEVLSDVDGLLDSFEALIAKKQAIKQAAMQQLLTGRTRLPGFSRAWEAKRLGEVAHIKTGSKNNEDKNENGQYPFFVRSAVVERINSYCFDGEAILIPGEGGIGSIFHYINGRFDCHQRVYMISRFLDDVCGKLIYYSMVLQFGNHAMQNTVKATVDSLRLPTFKNFSFSIPMDIAEQHAIASVLSDMDAEITALEQRRDKTRAIKQGMMQQLLTGRMRLVKPNTVSNRSRKQEPK